MVIVVAGVSDGAPILAIPILRIHLRVPPYCGPPAWGVVFTGTAAEVVGATPGAVVAGVVDELQPTMMKEQINRNTRRTNSLFINTS